MAASYKVIYIIKNTRLACSLAEIKETSSKYDSQAVHFWSLYLLRLSSAATFTIISTCYVKCLVFIYFLHLHVSAKQVYLNCFNCCGVIV